MKREQLMGNVTEHTALPIALPVLLSHSVCTECLHLVKHFKSSAAVY